MGSLFRSEKMTLAQLILQSEAAYSCIRELGELGKVQFRDLNPMVSAFQRKFTNEVRRCDEMERQLRFLTNELEKAGIEIRLSEGAEAPDPQEMIDLESKFEALEEEVKEIKGNTQQLKKGLLDLTELNYILHKTQGFFEEAEHHSRMTPPITPPPPKISEERELLDAAYDMDTSDAKDKGPINTKFMYVTGVINQKRMGTFERVLWRACHGNVFLRQAEIEEPLEDPITGLTEYKVVFILFFQGDQLRKRVRKICEGFQATLYECPETAAERQEMSVAVKQRIVDLQSVLQTTREHSSVQFNSIAKELETWKTKVVKIKGIYHTLNMFNLDIAQHCLIAECWCPVEDLDEIQQALTRGTERNGTTVPTILNRVKCDDKPPTYNKVNKFTRGFQAIVDAYGVATYEEVNPTPYTIITFPFLFAVMFGDIGHGLIMAVFALTLIIFEKKLANTNVGGELFTTVYHGRYIVVLMGVFSIYTGFVYNDIFSKSFNIFGSSWNAAYTSVENGLTIQTHLISECCPSVDDTSSNCVIMGGSSDYESVFPREAMRVLEPYPFGVDPVWNVAKNELTYMNSYKMKVAIILGIFQMLFGVCLSVFNHVHFKRYSNIVLEFVPQLLFLFCIFGWLVFMIFYKWCYYYEDPNTAPSLLIILIDMFLEIGSSPSVDPSADVSDNDYSVFAPTAKAAEIQVYIQLVLVVVIVACIPWMFIKPFYLLLKQKLKPKGYDLIEPPYEDSDNESMTSEVSKEVESISSEGDVEKHAKQTFDFSETMVYQAIHTIEYCLGTISNTASYLRLWALSLAHYELSDVLWTMIFEISIEYAVTYGPGLGSILVFLGFAVWAVLTVAILLVMEGLSAFLHALRLHWVEFQSKFYDGNGYKFRPFSFEAILSGEVDEE